MVKIIANMHVTSPTIYLQLPNVSEQFCVSIGKLWRSILQADTKWVLKINTWDSVKIKYFIRQFWDKISPKNFHGDHKGNYFGFHFWLLHISS